MKQIELTKGKISSVDDEMEPIFSQWKWQCSDKGYAVRGTRVFGEYKNVFMHQIIAYVKFGFIPDGYTPDHKDGNRLNNTSSNIRLATSSQNSFNRRCIEGKTSRFKGVYLKKSNGKWAAQITKDGKHQHLGYRDSEEECAVLYDTAAKELFGEYARLNFPEP